MAHGAADIEAEIRGAFEAMKPFDGPVVITDQFKNEQNHPAGIRAPHALDAMKDVRAIDRWGFGSEPADGSISVALAAPTPRRSYAMLLTAFATPATDNVLSIAQAWRLYGDWPTSPTAALAAFIARYGKDVVVGDNRARFIAKATVQGASETSLLSIPDATARGKVTASASFRTNKDGTTSVWWVYGIDVDDYNADVNRSRN